MSIVMRIILFAATAVLGFYAMGTVIAAALRSGLIAALPPDDQIHNFNVAYFGGGFIVLLLATGIGVISFFTEGKLRKILAVLPLLAPLLYCIAVLTYFSR